MGARQSYRDPEYESLVKDSFRFFLVGVFMSAREVITNIGGGL